MQKWEYLRVSISMLLPLERSFVSSVNGHVKKPCPEVDSYMASLGEQGWERVATAGQAGKEWIFKRPKV